MAAPVDADPAAIAVAARLIRAGDIVAMPTETVYGLAADATDGRAVARIYAVKGRPRFNPLIVHVASLDEARSVGEMTPLAERLAALWPGPLTMVVRARAEAKIAGLVTAGLDTVALRIPGHRVARALITAAGRPLAAPSANRSGRISPTTAVHVAADLGADVAMILDGGPCQHGVESTIVDISGGRLVVLRPGAVTAEALARVAGVPVEREVGDATRPSAPGQLVSHYAPTARVRLNASSAGPGEALLAFGPDVPPAAGTVVNLSPAGDLVEAAQNLFTALRVLDVAGVTGIAVMPIPAEGLGEAINDRLARAAAPRN